MVALRTVPRQISFLQVLSFLGCPGCRDVCSVCAWPWDALGTFISLQTPTLVSEGHNMAVEYKAPNGEDIYRSGNVLEEKDPDLTFYNFTSAHLPQEQACSSPCSFATTLLTGCTVQFVYLSTSQSMKVRTHNPCKSGPFRHGAVDNGSKNSSDLKTACE